MAKSPTWISSTDMGLLCILLLIADKPKKGPQAQPRQDQRYQQSQARQAGIRYKKSFCQDLAAEGGVERPH
jgi:hypothetical protein